jgi:hypothetical protein
MFRRENIKEFSSVEWPDMDGRGHYKLVPELQFSTLNLDGPNKLSLSEISQRIYFEEAKFRVTKRPATIWYRN